MKFSPKWRFELKLAGFYLAASLIVMTCLPEFSAAQIVYQIDHSLPVTDGNGGSNTLTVNGTVTTDGTIGNLAPSNIVSWSITFDSDNLGLEEFNPTNSLWSINAGMLEATADTLISNLITNDFETWRLVRIGDPAATTWVWGDGGGQSMTNLFVRLRDSGGTVDLHFLPHFEPMTFGMFGTRTNLVTTAADIVDAMDGLTSLREAIAFAEMNPGADTITFASGTGEAFENGGTIRLTQGELVIASDLTIDGSAPAAITITGDAGGDDSMTIDPLGNTITDAINNTNIGDNSQLFHVTAGSSTLNQLVMTGGVALTGGGILIDDGASLTVNSSSLSGNQTQSGSNFGGGLRNRGTAVLSGTTVFGNLANHSGGGICMFLSPVSATLTILDSTIAGNQATFSGAGIFSGTGEVMTVLNSTVADNRLTDSLIVNGAGILAQSTTNLINTTISGNSALEGGGFGNGLAVDDGTTTLTNTMILGNQATNNADLSVSMNATLVQTGGNIIGDTFSIDGVSQQTGITADDVFAQTQGNNGVDAGVLANNGGQGHTIALKSSLANPALDAGQDNQLDESVVGIDLNGDGDMTDLIGTDARGMGFPRFIDVANQANNGVNLIDIGAFELQTDTDFIFATGDFFSPTNWSNGVPDLTLNGFVRNGGTATANTGGTVQALSLIVGDIVNGGDGTLILDGVDLEVAEDFNIAGTHNSLTVGDQTVEGSVTVQDTNLFNANTAGAPFDTNVSRVTAGDGQTVISTGTLTVDNVNTVNLGTDLQMGIISSPSDGFTYGDSDLATNASVNITNAQNVTLEEFDGVEINSGIASGAMLSAMGDLNISNVTGMLSMEGEFGYLKNNAGSNFSPFEGEASSTGTLTLSDIGAVDMCEFDFGRLVVDKFAGSTFNGVLTMDGIALIKNVPDFSIDYGFDINRIFLQQETAGAIKGTIASSVSFTLDNVAATASDTFIGVIQGHDFGPPVTEPEVNVNTSLIMAGSSLLVPRLELGTKPAGYVANLSTTLKMNPSYIDSTFELIIGDDATVEFHLEGITRANAANVLDGSTGLYSSMDAADALLEGTIIADFDFTPTAGTHVIDLIVTDSLTALDESTMTPADFQVVGLNPGFTVDSFGIVEDGTDIVRLKISGTPVLLGDVNLDGVVNLLDVSPFIELISSGEFQIEGDINQDGVINLLDVSRFIEILSGS